MSCYYKLLPRLIPEIILSSGIESEIAIVSPWIQAVDLIPPRFGLGKSLYTQEKIKLDDFLKRMLLHFKMKLIILTRPDDYRTERVLECLRTTDRYGIRNNLTVRYYEHIHAKMIVTPDFAIETTANIIPTSLFRNIESCTLVNNRFGNTRKYIKNKLGDVL